MTLNEANTRKQLIDRALESVGWKDEYLNCEYAFTDGKKTPGGGKGKQCSVDYLLQYNNTNGTYYNAFNFYCNEKFKLYWIASDGTAEIYETYKAAEEAMEEIIKNTHGE